MIRFRVFVDGCQQDMAGDVAAVFIHHQRNGREIEIYHSAVDAPLYSGEGLSVRVAGGERICQVVVGERWPWTYQAEHLRAALHREQPDVEAEAVPFQTRRAS